MESFDDRTRSDASIDSSFDEKGLSEGTKKRMLDLLSVRYVLDRSENASSERIFPPQNYHIVRTYQDWTVFENLNAAPRAFIAQNIYKADSITDVNTLLFSNTFDTKTSAIVPSDISIAPFQQASGTASFITFEPERVAVKTNANSNAIFVLTDTYDPDWKASIDGYAADIFPVNFTFRGVRIPIGTHFVTFEYRPQSVQTGTLISELSLLFTVGLLFVLSKRKT